MEALYRKKDYQNVEGGLKGKYRNVVFKDNQEETIQIYKHILENLEI